jgi:hypothetical protein
MIENLKTDWIFQQEYVREIHCLQLLFNLVLDSVIRNGDLRGAVSCKLKQLTA